VQKGMELIAQGIEKGGKWVEEKTNGVITAETFDSLINEGMALGGLKGSAALAKRMTPKEKAPNASRVEPTMETPGEPDFIVTPSGVIIPRRPAPTNTKFRDATEASTGVPTKSAKQQKQEQAARRKEARQAFENDPRYADYLKNYGEYEASVRERAGPLAAPGTVEGPRTPRTGLREATMEEPLPHLDTPNIEIPGKLNALDSALQKTAKGQRFALTADELAALRSSNSPYARPQLLDKEGKPITQRGAATQEMTELVAKLGLTAGLAAYAYQNRDQAAALGAAGMGSIAGARSALGPLMRESGYTIKLLERLPEGRTEFSRKQIEQELNRQDVTAHEKNLVNEILGDKEKITAKELVDGFQQRARDLELKPHETQDYADYGLENINRHHENFNPNRWEAEGDGSPAPATQELVPNRTTIYQSPREIRSNNHFDDPNYFAHTRSFDEGGVRHVVEVQSDVAQHAKALKPGEAEQIRSTVDSFNTTAQKLDAAFNEANGRSDWATNSPAILEALRKAEEAFGPDVLLDNKLVLGKYFDERAGNELVARMTSLQEQAKAEAAGNRSWGDYDAIYDEAKALLESGDITRQERQSIHDAFLTALIKRTTDLELRAREMRAKLSGSVPSELEPLLKNWYKRIIREEVNQADGKPLRFATADTVAKVEGWPQGRPDIEGRLASAIDAFEREQRLHERYAENWKNLPENLRAERERAFEERLQEHRDRIEELEAVRAQTPRFSPEHQSIYDRYRGDVEKFLKNELKAKPYTDQHGHTWLEVPAQPRGPVRMFGRSTTRQVAALAALSGVALGLEALSDGESTLTEDIAGGAMAAGAVLGSKRGIGYGAAAAGVAAYLSSDENRLRNAAIASAVFGVAAHASSSNKHIAKWAEGTTRAAEVVAGNLSAELRGMSPALLRRYTQHEQRLKVREHNAMVKISPAAEALLKLPKAVREVIDVALFSGRRDLVTQQLIKNGHPELAKQMKDLFSYIDETGKELQNYGLLRKLDPGHFPRIVTDLDGLMVYLGKEGGDYLGRKLADAATESLKKTGTPLSDIEMSRVVNEHILAAVHRADLGGQSGILKKRTIEQMTAGLLPFYATAADSIALYARAASREIERARFFGKDLVKARDTLAVNVDASIGNLISRERQAGKLSHEQLDRLESLTKARFGPGERSSHWLTQSYKNIVQGLLLGNPFSAMVQFGDAAIAVAVHGIVPSITSVAKTLTKNQKWHLSDFGLVNHITEDLVRGARDPMRVGGHEISSAKFVDGMLKYSGFSLVDEFSKLVQLNAAAARFERLARTPKGVKEIQQTYGDYFGTDTTQLIYDLKQGKKSPLVGELIFRELSDVQPISKLEMPQGYLASPETRVLYTLKSFMLKQMNLARERGFREIMKGDPASVKRGVSFLTRYSIALGISGASLSFINDWLMGREPSFEAKNIAENVFRTFGWSSYAVDQARKGKALQAAAGVVAPPYKLFEEIWATPEELEKFANDDPKANPKGAMYFPLVGKLIYNRALGGAERHNKRLERQRQREEATQ
jgi:hypothetical protein